jgi:hypothetical protein
MGVPDCNEQARRSDHLILNLAWSESLRRSVAFQWFFTAFSVRPDSSLAISAHLKECICVRHVVEEFVHHEDSLWGQPVILKCCRGTGSP